MAYKHDLQNVVNNGVPGDGGIKVVNPGIVGLTFAAEADDARVLDWLKGDYPAAGGSTLTIVRSLNYGAFHDWCSKKTTGPTANRLGHMQEVIDGSSAHQTTANKAGARALLMLFDNPNLWIQPDPGGGGEFVTADRLRYWLNKLINPGPFAAEDRSELLNIGEAVVGAGEAAVHAGLLRRMKDDASMLSEIADARAL